MHGNQKTMISAFRLSPRIYLERFDDGALLLVADRNRLLCVNDAAADLFDEISRTFASKSFTVEQGYDWLASQYELHPGECLARTRGLLAFGLRQGLIRQVRSER